MGPIPDKCNTISFKEGKYEYSRDNCFWDFRPRGRPKKSETVTLRFIHIGLDKKTSDFLNERSKQESIKKKKFLSPNDIVKDLIEKYRLAFDNSDLFENKRLKNLTQRFK